MKSYFLKVTVAGVFVFSLLFIGVVVLAQTEERSVSQPVVEQTAETSPLPPPPPPPPPPADSQPTSMPPENFSGREGTMPPPPNDFRETRTEQREQRGDFTRPQKPPMMPGADMQERVQKERMMNDKSFQDQRMEQGGSRTGRDFEGMRRGDSGQNDGDDWEAREQKMEEQRQKREEQMVKRQAAQMAKNLQQNVNSINKRIAKLTKAGIRLTAECSEVVAALSDAAAKVKNAVTREDLEDAQDIMHSMQDLNDCRQIIERLQNAPRMLKNAATAVKNLKRKKVDVSQVEPMLTALTTRFSAFKTGNSTNEDVEAFFDEMDSLGSIMAPLMGKPKNSTQGASVFQSSGAWETIKSWFGL